MGKRKENERQGLRAPAARAEAPPGPAGTGADEARADERPLTPWGPRGAGPRRSPQGGGARKRMGFGEGPAAEFCCYRVTEYRADGGRGGLLDDPLATEGEGPYPKGARLRASPGRAR